MTKLFFDQNLSYKLCARLSDLFPGSDQARLAGLDRASDAELWAHAGVGGYVLVSQDADFAQLAALHGPPPKVVWLRGGNRATASVEATLRANAVAITGLAREAGSACLEIVG